MPIKKALVSSYGAGGDVHLNVDTLDDKLIVHERVNVDAIRENVKELREDHQQIRARVGSQNHMRHLAEVPMTVYNQSIREKWGRKEWRRWLNDPDNAALRVTHGRV